MVPTNGLIVILYCYKDSDGFTYEYDFISTLEKKKKDDTYST